MAQKPKTRKFEVFYRDARYPKTLLSAQVEAFNPTAARVARYVGTLARMASTFQLARSSKSKRSLPHER